MILKLGVEIYSLTLRRGWASIVTEEKGFCHLPEILPESGKPCGALAGLPMVWK